MHYDKSKRELLKFSLTTMVAGLISTGNAGATGGRTARVLSVALIDLLSDRASREFRRKIGKEWLRIFPPNHRHNLVDLPRPVWQDRQKLEFALKEMPFFACVSGSATATISAAEILPDTPIIFNLAGDPTLLGVAKGARGVRPNVTGFTSFTATHAKRWEILFDAFPQIRKILVLTDSADARIATDAILASASGKKVEAQKIDIKKNISQQLDRALAQKDIGVDIPHTTFSGSDPFTIISHVNSAHLPSIYDGTHYARWGGLLGYEADPIPEAETICEYLLQLLRGATPSMLPIRYPSAFTLSVNLETATASHLELKKSLLIRANTVFDKTIRPVWK